MPVIRNALNIEFGQELQTLRQACGITQEQLAFKAGLHRTHISLLERGARSPTLDTLFALCSALGASPAELVGRIEQTRPRPKSRQRGRRESL